MKHRLDQHLYKIGLADSRSQAENFIKLGEVKVNDQVVKKTGYFVDENDDIKVTAGERYVSRAGLKLASVAQEFGLDFKDKNVLDVGSSTGGFTDYALQHGAKKVIAVDVGTKQLHPKLRGDERIDLREQTDIREIANLSQKPDIVVIDVSFISLKEILPAVAELSNKGTNIVAMLKPQFEAGDSSKHKGVIKNERMRRDILKNFELWAKEHFVILDKADSKVHGAKGNQERFFLLKKISV